MPSSKSLYLPFGWVLEIAGYAMIMYRCLFLCKSFTMSGRPLKFFRVDRPIFAFVHAVYVPPLDVVWNPRVAVPLDDSLKVGGVVVPPPTQVEPQRPEGRQVGSPDHLCVLSGHIQGGTARAQQTDREHPRWS